jgi:hypothetical protein
VLARLGGWFDGTSRAKSGQLLPEPYRFCSPDGATFLQAERVVVRYLEIHPEKLQMNFQRLATAALREAWPCSRSSASR